MPLKFITGDLVENGDDQVIAHQCNCITSYGKGLSKIIFDKYPYANIYNVIPRYAGSIMIRRPPSEEKGPIVVGMMAQFHPGASKIFDDSRQIRLTWFKMCLQKTIDFMKLNNLRTLGLPYKIGCGLAKGLWEDYFDIIERMSEKTPEIEIRIYKLPFENERIKV